MEVSERVMEQAMVTVLPLRVPTPFPQLLLDLQGKSLLTDSMVFPIIITEET